MGQHKMFIADTDRYVPNSSTRLQFSGGGVGKFICKSNQSYTRWPMLATWHSKQNCIILFHNGRNTGFARPIVCLAVWRSTWKPKTTEKI